MRLYGEIQKVEPQDDGTIRVYGVASTETVDADGEVILADAMRAAIPEYLRFPALREMHAASAAGTTLEIEVGDDKVTRIVAHVVDPVAVLKVREGVYRGFSIGGRVTARDPANRKIVTGLSLAECSLVDRPSCPDATIQLFKAADASQVAKRTFTAEERREAARTGAAMPGGRFPIYNLSDLRHALELLHHAPDRADVIAHLQHRASALGLLGDLPAGLGGSKGVDEDEAVAKSIAAALAKPFVGDAGMQKLVSGEG